MDVVAIRLVTIKVVTVKGVKDFTPTNGFIQQALPVISIEGLTVVFVLKISIFAIRRE